MGVGVALSHVALTLRHSDDRSLLGNVSLIQARLDSIDDTLRAISRRDQQIRLLAGLESDSALHGDSAGATLTIGHVSEMSVASRVGCS